MSRSVYTYAPNAGVAEATAATNEALASEFFDLLRQRDIDKWKILWAEDGVYQIPYDDPDAKYDMPVERDGTITTIVGRDNIAQCFSVIPRFVERADLTDVNVRQTLDPELLYVEFNLAFLIRKTQLLYRNIGIGRIRIVGGKVTFFREYLDLAQRKLGWAGVFF